jgi:hypothetical protein
LIVRFQRIRAGPYDDRSWAESGHIARRYHNQVIATARPFTSAHVLSPGRHSDSSTAAKPHEQITDAECGAEEPAFRRAAHTRRVATAQEEIAADETPWPGPVDARFKQAGRVCTPACRRHLSPLQRLHARRKGRHVRVQAHASSRGDSTCPRARSLRSRAASTCRREGSTPARAASTCARAKSKVCKPLTQQTEMTSSHAPVQGRTTGVQSRTARVQARNAGVRGRKSHA